MLDRLPQPVCRLIQFRRWVKGESQADMVLAEAIGMESVARLERGAGRLGMWQQKSSVDPDRKRHP